MNIYNVLGVSIEDKSLRQQLEFAFGSLENKSLNTVCLLDTELLMKIKDDETAKAAVMAMDMLVAGSTELLKSGGITSKSRFKEVESGLFLQGFLKKLGHDKKKIFLIGSSQEELKHLREVLLSIENRLTFFGSATYGNDDTSADGVVNNINSVLPDVIISMAESPKQELLVSENRAMVNAAMWVCLQPGNLEIAQGHMGRMKKFINYLENRIFRRTVKQFDGQ